MSNCHQTTLWLAKKDDHRRLFPKLKFRFAFGSIMTPCHKRDQEPISEHSDQRACVSARRPNSLRDRHQPAIAKSQKQEHGTRCDALFRSIRLMGFADYGLELLRRACAGRKGKSRPVSSATLPYLPCLLQTSAVLSNKAKRLMLPKPR